MMKLTNSKRVLFRFWVALIASSCGLTFGAPHTLVCGLNQLRERPAPIREASAQLLPAANTDPEPAVIDIMFLYTPDTIIGAGDESTLQGRIREAVSEANYLYTNSQVNISINPVYMGKVVYTESGDIQSDLQNLAAGSGQFSGVATLRNDYKADIVVLVTEFENQGIGGLAWDIPPLRGNAAAAFLAIRRVALGRNLTLAHELGHLMGCAHDREHAGDPNSPYYLVRRPYIFGNRLTIEGVTYIDVMAYEPGVALPYFANPLIQLDGVALGRAEGESLPSDTARTINETAPYVSAYRQALSRIEFKSTRRDVLRSSGAVTLELTRSGILTNSTRVTVTVQPESTAVAGLDYLTPPNATVQFVAGQSNATFSIELVTNAAEVKTLILGLTAPLGSHGIGLQGQTTLVLQDQIPVVQSSTACVNENSGSVRFIPAFNGQVSETLPEISWHTLGDSATGGRDFVEASGKLQIALTNGAYQIEPLHIQILDNAQPQLDRTFKIVFDGTTHGGVTYGPATNDIRIVDDDRPGGLKDAPGANLNPDAGFNVAVRSDRKMLVWGSFSRLQSIRRTGVALLNPDGTVDESFRPPELLAGHHDYPHFPNAYVGTVLPLRNGQFLVAGEFNRVDGKERNTLIRLNADGTLDETFGQNLKFDGSVDAVALQADGKILVGGAFEKINGERRSFIARLQPDGSVDDSFKPKGGPSSSWTVFILTIEPQADGKILIGGFFEQVDGQSALNLARLNADGTFDETFKMRDVSGPVRELAIQNDGRILIAGTFDTLDGMNSRKLARLNPDGSVDSSFVPPMPNSDVLFITPMPDGHILINGIFTRVDGADKRYLALLNNDGSLDLRFDSGTGPDDRIGGTSIYADGSLYVPGRLKQYNGLPAANLARVKLPESSSVVATSDLNSSELTLNALAFPGDYIIETSTDLSHWTEANSATVPGFSSVLTATIPKSESRSFLRLRSKE